MAKTPYSNLGSEDILSAHVNGVQYSVNNMEEVLQMGTATKAGQVLQPVSDMADPALRYRIYEAIDKSWLLHPVPKIYRDGNVVAEDEYKIQPAYGAIIFSVQQPTTAIITADFTHVTETSGRLDAIDVEVDRISPLGERVSDVEDGLETVQTGVSALDNRVTSLESSSGGGSGEGSAEISLGHVGAELDPNPAWWANFKQGLDLYDRVWEPNLTMGAGSIDLFPIYVPYATVFDALRVTVGEGNWIDGNMRLGVYSNKGLKPDKLLAQTKSFYAYESGEYDALITTDGEGAVIEGGRITLDAGLYWLGRYHSSGFAINGTDGVHDHMITIADPNDLTIVNGGGSYPIGGVRVSGVSDLLPVIGDFETGSVEYLRRMGYGVTWIRKASSY